MKYKLKVSSIIAALLLAGCSTTHWGYEGAGAPENWGNLSDEYKACSLGQYQTPINIENAILADLPELSINYITAFGSVVDNGHTIQVNITGGDASLNFDEERFDLKQFHFHGPSENLIAGKSFPIEMHLVHMNDAGKLAVIGVMYEVGQSNELISAIISHVSDKQNNPVAIDTAIDFEQLLPVTQGYYRFSGSLTTPPCSEGVSWIVMKEAQSISKEQKEQMDTLFKHTNNRPIQELNGRVIVMTEN